MLRLLQTTKVLSDLALFILQYQKFHKIWTAVYAHQGTHQANEHSVVCLSGVFLTKKTAEKLVVGLLVFRVMGD